ncbi:MAG: hypothetical protein JRE24_05275 [Deltaproteobacteria bacterium]|nr:hypothetical protein [Deltaproteobacteria bacterium]
MSKAAQARPPRLSARDGGQGFSSRRTDRTPQDGLFTSRRRKPAENAAHRKKGHLWMETN